MARENWSVFVCFSTVWQRGRFRFRFLENGSGGSGSGFGSWKTVPAVPVPLSVSGKTVPTVPVSGSGSVPEPPCKIDFWAGRCLRQSRPASGIKNTYLWNELSLSPGQALSGLVAGDSAICGRLAALILRLRPAGLRFEEFRSPVKRGGLGLRFSNRSGLRPAAI